MVIAYITCKGINEAKKISRHLLEKRLIACSNMFPIESMYWWEGKIVNDNEYAIIAKTSGKNFKNLEKEIKKIHSYKIPCIVKIKAEANDEYEGWLNTELI